MSNVKSTSKDSKDNMVRMNLYMPASFKTWIEEQSVKTGMKQSTYVVMALKTYMDQQKTMELMPQLINTLADLKGTTNTEEVENLLKLISKNLQG